MRVALQTYLIESSQLREVYYHSLSQTLEPALSSRPSWLAPVLVSISVSLGPEKIDITEFDMIFVTQSILYTPVAGAIYAFFIVIFWFVCC